MGAHTTVRLYVYCQSRAGAVVERVLRHTFQGVLVSDFYGAYNVYAGTHQRCWVHLLRDLHTLKEAHPTHVRVQRWCRYVRKYDAKAQTLLRTQPDLPQAARERLYVTLVERMRRLGRRYAQQKGHPCQALAKRLLRHQDELFQFVLVAGVPADNKWASGASVRSWWCAKSVGARAVRQAVRPAWTWLPCSAPGRRAG